MAALKQFFATILMPTNWKETLVILLPKSVGANYPLKFRPISLCCTIYKVAAKVLVNRFKHVLPNIIATEQGVFVPGRSISHHCLLAQEVFNIFKHSTSTQGFMAFKIDMEQAYDKMD